MLDALFDALGGVYQTLADMGGVSLLVTHAGLHKGGPVSSQITAVRHMT